MTTDAIGISVEPDELDEGDELLPGEAESHYHERIAAVYDGDRTTLSPTEQDDFMARYEAQD